MSSAFPLFFLSLILRIPPGAEAPQLPPCPEKLSFLKVFEGDFLADEGKWFLLRSAERQKIAHFLSTLSPGRYLISSTGCEEVEVLITGLAILLHFPNPHSEEAVLQVISRDTGLPAGSTQFSIWYKNTPLWSGVTDSSGLVRLVEFSRYLPAEIRIQRGKHLNRLTVEKLPLKPEENPFPATILYAFSDGKVHLFFFPSPFTLNSTYRVLDEKRRQMLAGDLRKPLSLTLPQRKMDVEVTRGERKWSCSLHPPRINFAFPPLTPPVEEIFLQKTSSTPSGVEVVWKTDKEGGRKWFPVQSNSSLWESIPLPEVMKKGLSASGNFGWIEVEGLRKFFHWNEADPPPLYINDIYQVPEVKGIQFLFLPEEIVPISPRNTYSLPLAPSLQPGFWREILEVEKDSLKKHMQFIRIEPKLSAELEQFPESAIGGQNLSLPPFAEDMLILVTSPDLSPIDLFQVIPPQLVADLTLEGTSETPPEQPGSFCRRVEWIQQVPRGEKIKFPLPFSPGIYQLLIIPISNPLRIVRRIFRIPEGFFVQGNYEKGNTCKAEVTIFPFTQGTYHLLMRADLPIRVETRPKTTQIVRREWPGDLAESEEISLFMPGSNPVLLGLWRPPVRPQHSEEDAVWNLIPSGPFLFSLLLRTGRIKNLMEGWDILSDLMDWAQAKLGFFPDTQPELLSDALLLKAMYWMRDLGFSPDEGLQAMVRSRWLGTPEQTLFLQLLDEPTDSPTLCPLIPSSCIRTPANFPVRVHLTASSALIELSPDVESERVFIFLPLPEGVSLQKVEGIREGESVLQPAMDHLSFYAFTFALRKGEKREIGWEPQWQGARMFIWIPGKKGGWWYE
ncbi:MAG: hypothetical protein V2G34_01565 [bacterium JZ-2024 1]